MVHQNANDNISQSKWNQTAWRTCDPLMQGSLDTTLQTEKKLWRQKTRRRQQWTGRSTFIERSEKFELPEIERTTTCLKPDHTLTKTTRLDWIVHGFAYPPTQYTLYGRWVLQVRRPKQQYQSTEGKKLQRKNQKKKIHNTHIQLYIQNSRQ